MNDANSMAYPDHLIQRKPIVIMIDQNSHLELKQVTLIVTHHSKSKTMHLIVVTSVQRYLLNHPLMIVILVALVVVVVMMVGVLQKNGDAGGGGGTKNGVDGGDINDVSCQSVQSFFFYSTDTSSIN